jgi:hypothetical protein
MPVRALARKYDVHRRTVRQAIASPMPPDRKVPVRAAPVREAVAGWMGSTSSTKRSGRVARTSRKVAVSGGSLTLRHLPTGITVQGEIPEGHYSRREFAAEQERLRTTLWKELEDRVARDPGLKRLRGRTRPV